MKKGNDILSEKGYTLIEVLVAFVLLAIVIVPLTEFGIRLFTQTKISDKINAINLAENEMETCMASRDFNYEQKKVILNGKKYEVTRNIAQEGRLIYISVTVKRNNSDMLLILLRTITSRKNGTS